MKEFNPSGAIEKASVDESYADLTQEVWSILAKCEGDDEGHEQLVKLIEECKGNTHVAREEQDERERKAIAVSRDEQVSCFERGKAEKDGSEGRGKGEDLTLRCCPHVSPSPLATRPHRPKLDRKHG